MQKRCNLGTLLNLWLKIHLGIIDTGRNNSEDLDSKSPDLSTLLHKDCLTQQYRQVIVHTMTSTIGQSFFFLHCLRIWRDLTASPLPRIMHHDSRTGLRSRPMASLATSLRNNSQSHILCPCTVECLVVWLLYGSGAAIVLLRECTCGAVQCATPG